MHCFWKGQEYYIWNLYHPFPWNSYKFTTSNTNIRHYWLWKINTLIFICKVSILVHSNCLTYHIIVSLIENKEWTLKKAYPIPRKHGKVFTGLVITQNITIENQHEYTNIDQNYLRDYCNRKDEYMLCKPTTPTHFLTNPDCSTNLIKTNQNGQLRLRDVQN